MPATGHLVKFGLTVAFATVLVAAAALTGSAASATPTAARNQASLAAVSCRGSNWCMAVGTFTAKSKVHALAQIWNGSKWRLVSKVPGTELSSVSCLTDTAAAATMTTRRSCSRSSRDARQQRRNQLQRRTGLRRSIVRAIGHLKRVAFSVHARRTTTSRRTRTGRR